MKGLVNLLLVVPLLAMFMAQLIKVFQHKFQKNTWNWRLLFETGGMPSSHSALVCSMATEMGISYGWNSPWFVICTIFALIVMYDASGVRRQAGEHSLILQEIIKQTQQAGLEIACASAMQLRHWHKKGHTPTEVCGGMLLGIGISWLVYGARFLLG